MRHLRIAKMRVFAFCRRTSCCLLVGYQTSVPFFFLPPFWRVVFKSSPYAELTFRLQSSMVPCHLAYMVPMAMGRSSDPSCYVNNHPRARTLVCLLFHGFRIILLRAFRAPRAPHAHFHVICSTDSKTSRAVAKGNLFRKTGIMLTPGPNSLYCPDALGAAFLTLAFMETV